MIEFSVGEIFGWMKEFMLQMGIYTMFSVAMQIAIIVTLTSFLFSLLNRR